MSAPFEADLVLSGGIVVDVDGRVRADVAIKDGIVVAIGAPETMPAARERVDVSGLHLLPGAIDVHVHFREPGYTHKEDWGTGTAAAAMGGTTTVFEMPNTNPLTTSPETLEDKIARATGRMSCDFAFWVGGTHENCTDVGELERLPGAAGIKVFMGSSTGSLLVEDDDGVFEILKRTRRRAAFHSEDEEMLRERRALRVEGDARSHPVWRSPETAMKATTRLVEIARRAAARIHVLHISTKEEISYLAQHKDVASCEATPNHLTLTAPECYERLGAFAQMNPPVREADHQAGIWEGVRQGIIDVLGSDHAPHTRAEKEKVYPATPSGMTGVQTLVPIMLDHVNAGRLTLERFVDLTSAGPKRLFGIARKGRIAVGYDADFTVVDLKRRETITNDWIASKCGWTPFDGVAVTGWPVGTVVRGAIVMWEGDLVAPGQGAPVLFEEALPR